MSPSCFFKSEPGFIKRKRGRDDGWAKEGCDEG